MSLQLQEESLRERVRLMVAPVCEMLHSLHVLADPSHHLPNQRWAEATVQRLSPALREDITCFGRCCEQWLTIVDLVYLVGAPDLPFAAFCEGVAALEPEQVVMTAFMGLSTAPLEDERRLSSDPAVVHAYQEARKQPQRFVELLLRTLSAYQETIFTEEWERRRPLLERKRALLAARLKATEPAHWLETLHARISVEQATLVVQKYREFRFPLDALKHLHCIVSSFTAPHVIATYSREELYLYINVPPVLPAPETIPIEITQLTKALADETRLRLYQLVLQHPRSLQELAQRVRLSESTVSRHLKVLKAARLVQSTKEGATLLYTGTLAPVDTLPLLLREFVQP
ncbi:ArsR/SmtB family transcription factor [Thermosporothrix hazakensis]|nr:metalloregulator ArsR/SmtB family transcription factor [Thermosporothrix hazakensis]GCE48106.1 transcriptional regulator [Thermosporothrix hazakensis]